MKITFSWLKEYLETEASLDEVLAKLNSIGLEVDGLEDPAKAFEGFVVGEVLEAERHPDADKLQCLVVDTGKEKLKVVCGAPNARKGLKGVFAPAGSYIPGLGVTLKKANIRGQESNGMMCSEKELCLSDEHKGIIELPSDLKTGMSAAEALGLNDVIIEISITPDRADCTSSYGVARDLAAAGVGKLKSLATNKIKGEFKSSIGVEIKDQNAGDLFIGRYIKGVKNGASPKWMQDRLKAIGLRPISALVDITNYLTFDLGRPLHVYDADKVKGDIQVRFANEGEEVSALNDNSYKLDKTISVIADDSGALSISGIIGGTSTCADERTTNVFLECAYFNPTLITKMGQKLKIESDARYRFERGVDPEFTYQGAEIAAQMILDICGGVASEIVIAGKAPDIRRTVKLRQDRVKTLGGCDVEPTRQKEILEKLGFIVNSKGEEWEVTSPSWRHDIDAGEEDMVEEILRINSYDNIPMVYMTRDPAQGGVQLSPLQEKIKKVRYTLANNGMNEAITWAFMDEKKAELFGAKENPKRATMTLVAPITSELSFMRPSTLPNLIDAAGRNYDKGYPDSALFEIGRNFYSTDYVDQPVVATGVRSGNIVKRHWANVERKADAIDAKTDVVAALEACGVKVDSLQVVDEAPSHYHPGRSGAFKMGKNVVAYFGEIHPGVLAKMGREENFAGFEIFLQNLPDSRKKTTAKEMLKLSPLQPLVRDFAFLVDKNIEVEKILRAVRNIDKKMITNVDLFDIYTGKGVDEDKKSIAFTVTIQPQDKSLTDEEIGILSKKIISVIEEQTGGKLRA